MAELAAPLAEATAAARRSVQELSADALVRVEAAQDSACEARTPALRAMASDVRAARTRLDAMHAELQAFCTQLDEASQHIQQLQDTSTSLEEQLATQAGSEAQLSEWLQTAALAPSVVRTVLHTPIDEDVHAWMRAVRAIDTHLRLLNERDAAEPRAPALNTALAQVRTVAEQAKIAAIAKIRPHLLSLFQPIRTSVATTLPILQFSVLLPHQQPLYQFLATHAPRAAVEVQLAYVNAARLYYETAFRRYVRELKRILPRWAEPSGSVARGVKDPQPYAEERLQFALPNAALAPVVLAYMSEDASFRASPEHLFHTLALVFSDTACSEYAFLARFFAGAGMSDTNEASVMPAASMLSLTQEEEEKHDAHAAITAETWRQVMEPALFHFHDFREAVLGVPNPPLLMLLTTATLAQALLDLARARRCLSPELETAYMRHILGTWPLIARALDAEVGALKALSISGNRTARAAGLLERWTASEVPTNLAQEKRDVGEQLQGLLRAYVDMVKKCTKLNTQEGTLSSGLSRMRAELHRLLREYKTYAASHAATLKPAALCASVAEQLDTPEAPSWAALATELGAST